LHEAHQELKSIPQEKITPVEPEELNIPVMCNGFSVFGKATKDNNHYFGRDFMFPAGGVFQDTACMIIYNPKHEGSSDEDLFPFVSMTAPGIIGSIAIMNSRGIAAGVNMSPGANCNPDRPGLNSLLLLRHAVQHGASAKAAVRIMEALKGGKKIDYAKAKELIDFLSPKRTFTRYYENNPRSEDGEIVINGSISLCDLKNLTMESHYGYYCDEWVKINLARFMYV
jgi:hypothetical protein